MSRHLHFPDILNARDLGGLSTKNGGSTRHGVFVRTANLSELDKMVHKRSMIMAYVPSLICVAPKSCA